jgi:hypothetical protein
MINIKRATVRGYIPISGCIGIMTHLGIHAGLLSLSCRILSVMGSR